MILKKSGGIIKNNFIEENDEVGFFSKDLNST
jgi:hypothetical protein